MGCWIYIVLMEFNAPVSTAKLLMQGTWWTVGFIGDVTIVHGFLNELTTGGSFLVTWMPAEIRGFSRFLPIHCVKRGYFYLSQHSQDHEIIETISSPMVGLITILFFKPIPTKFLQVLLIFLKKHFSRAIKTVIIQEMLAKFTSVYTILMWNVYDTLW